MVHDKVQHRPVLHSQEVLYEVSYNFTYKDNKEWYIHGQV